MTLATTVNRIRVNLQRQFGDHIDMSDLRGRPSDQVERAFLSRALAALCIKSYVSADPETSAEAIVDGWDDGGIDAIHFDPLTDSLFLVQSKWSASGNSSFDEGASAKFANGVKRLLGAEFSQFNEKVRSKESEIREVLYSDRNIQIRLITVHTSKQALPRHVSRVISSLVAELNDPVPIADHVDVDQAGVYDLITAESRDAKIKLQAVLNDWGVIERPFLAYYGRVTVDQIVDWWKEHRNKLFSQNLRLYYQSSSVNDALRRTLAEEPEHFWYFNNGITIIADKVVKGLAGAPAHKFSNFACEGASVVNGAQTVGCIGNSSDPGQADGGSTDEQVAWVQVRLISLENCPPDFARRITRAANLQNAVGNREFAAMDPLQHRLAVEFALDKRRYVYKRGELDPSGEEGCSIVEATQALACAHSARLAVEVRREIGSLWADAERPPYTDIFRKDLTAEKVWRAVSVMRTTDTILHRLRDSDAPRADLVGTHMQRLILHLVFQKPEVRVRYERDRDMDELLVCVRNSVQPTFEKVAEYLQREHPNEYLANFSKNSEKCERLAQNYNTHPSLVPGQGRLFEDG